MIHYLILKHKYCLGEPPRKLDASGSIHAPVNRGAK